MIRWTFILPRLVLVAIVLLVLGIAFEPLLRWTLITAGESALRAKIDLGGLHTRLAAGELRLEGLAVADPRAPMKNLFEAEQLVLGVELVPLAQRKLVIREGAVHGLRVATDRKTSGEYDPQSHLYWKMPELPPIEVQLPKIDAAKIEDPIGGWFEGLGKLFSQQVAQQVEQLDSVRLGKELSQRWPAEFTRMENRAAWLKSEAEQLRNTAQNAPRDPVQGLDAYRRALSQAEQLQKEIAQFAAEVDRLKQQALHDKDAMAAAGQHDAERIRGWFAADKLNPEGLSEYFLGNEVTQRVEAVARWVAWARHYLPQATDMQKPVRDRGQDIVFVVRKPTPNLLARILTVDGTIGAGAEAFQFSGTVNDFTPQPELHSQPAVIRLAVSGQPSLRLEAVIDHTTATPRERLLVDCPALPLPQRQIGRPDQLSLTVAPGVTHLWVSCELSGDDLSGQIQIVQQPIRLKPSLGAKYAACSLESDLQVALGQIQTLQLAVDVSGKLTRPAWRLRCDLGPQLVGVLQTFVERELESRRAQTLAYVQQQSQTTLVQFDRMLAEKQETLAAKIQIGKQELQEITQSLAQRVPGVPNVPAVNQVLGGLPNVRF